MARTLEELNRTLAELGERQEKRRRLLAQWSVLRDETDRRSARAEELKQILARERRDVEELEGMSLKGLWLRITGDREVRLSKEEAEALAAQAKYEQALRDVEDARSRIAEMGRELEQVPDCTAEREAVLEEKRVLLRSAGGAAREQIIALEVDEAQRALSRFRTELADVELISQAQVYIGDFATFADYFFDGLFADLAVQEQIEQSRDSVVGAVQEVERVLARLKELEQEEDAGIARARAGLAHISEVG